MKLYEKITNKLIAPTITESLPRFLWKTIIRSQINISFPTKKESSKDRFINDKVIREHTKNIYLLLSNWWTFFEFGQNRFGRLTLNIMDAYCLGHQKEVKLSTPVGWRGWSSVSHASRTEDFSHVDCDTAHSRNTLIGQNGSTLPNGTFIWETQIHCTPWLPTNRCTPSVLRFLQWGGLEQPHPKHCLTE